jgi:hypothetical protein
MTTKTKISKSAKATGSVAKSTKARKKPPASNGSEKKLSAIAAAARVLAESKKPMSSAELIAAMTAKGYWTSPAGKTPEATLSAAIQREIGLKKDQARFKKTAPGRYALA